jgi:hypothetical protein|eukprot:7388234-Prymnesium_polylepis.2
MWTGGSAPRAAQPLPVATACFNSLAASLESLALTEITLAANVFSVCALPELHRVKLAACGAHADAIAKQLAGACPKLQAANAIVV